MRGKPMGQDATLVIDRNIPAYAGKTSNIIGRRSGATEHPRVCGENGQRLPMRTGVRRNIPAYAGKTWSLLSSF